MHREIILFERQELLPNLRLLILVLSKLCVVATNTVDWSTKHIQKLQLVLYNAHAKGTATISSLAGGTGIIRDVPTFATSVENTP